MKTIRQKYRSFETINLLIEYLIYRRLRDYGNNASVLINFKNSIIDFTKLYAVGELSPLAHVYDSYINRRDTGYKIEDLFCDTYKSYWEGFLIGYCDEIAQCKIKELRKSEVALTNTTDVGKLFKEATYYRSGKEGEIPYIIIHQDLYKKVLYLELRKKLKRVLEIEEEEGILEFKTPLLTKHNYFQKHCKSKSKTFLNFRSTIRDEFLEFIKNYFEETDEKALKMLIHEGTNPTMYLYFKDTAARLIDTLDKLANAQIIEKKVNSSIIKLPPSELEMWIFDHCKYWSNKEDSFVTFKMSRLEEFISKNKVECQKPLIEVKGNKMLSTFQKKK